MRSMLLYEFEAYRAVAVAGSFRGGARLLGITPSAMSQIVKRLEERVGVQLFHRTTRSVSPTDQGARLLVRLDRAFEEFDAATRELDDHRDSPSGTVRLLVPRVAYADLVEPVLAELHAACPNVVLDVSLDDALADIVSEGYDIGFRLGEYVHAETVAFPVGPPLRQIAVAAPRYLAAHGAPTHPRDLADHRCINWRQQPGDGPYVWEFEKNGVPVAVAVRGPLTVNDRAAAVRAAVEGIGIALWVEHRLRPLVARGDLVALLEDWSPRYPGFFAYYYRDRHMSAATKAVVAFLRKTLGTNARIDPGAT